MKLSHLQPVWEDSFTDKEKTTARLTVGDPIRRECVFTPDMPWEGNFNYANVLHDGDIYRMYYLTHLSSEDYCPKYDYTDSEIEDNKWLIHYTNSFVCYAESKDGISWQRPNLGIYEYRGSRENNIILRSEDIEGKYTMRDNFFVFIDENPDAPADERYKALSFECGRLDDSIPSSFREGLSYYASGDGIHFRFMRILPIREGTFDTLNVCSYDKREGRYVLYYRGWHGIPEGGRRIEGIRDVKRAESTDFINWSGFTEISYTDGKDEPMYTNNIMRYYRNTDIYVGFPTRYVERKEWTTNYDELTGAVARRERMQNGHPREGLAVTDGLFMCSRDGKTFTRYTEALFRPGPEIASNWVYGDCYPAYIMLETPSDDGENYEISMFVPRPSRKSESNKQKPESLFRYTLRRDGFAYYLADSMGARFVTKPFILGKGELYINFATSAFGSIRIRLSAADGSFTESAELFGDSDNRHVIFDGKPLSEFVGKEVTLSFEMLDARLYSFGLK